MAQAHKISIALGLVLIFADRFEDGATKRLDPDENLCASSPRQEFDEFLVPSELRVALANFGAKTQNDCCLTSLPFR
jgi:hypothetical protein